jgi:hypothetical protein
MDANELDRNSCSSQEHSTKARYMLEKKMKKKYQNDMHRYGLIY